MDIIEFPLQGAKKKKKVVKKPTEVVVDVAQKNSQLYFSALERITLMLKQNNPSLGTQTNIQLEKPQIDKLGSKKSLWKNFQAICDAMNREPQHVCQYFLIELGTQGSYSEEKLIIKGRFTSSNIETLIKKYLHEYVLCSLCRSQNTVLVKDQESRLYNKECKNCKATKTVTSLKMGKQK